VPGRSPLEKLIRGRASPDSVALKYEEGKRPEMSAKRVIATTMVVLGPLLVASVYLVLSRWPERWFTPMSDYAALGVAVLVGIAGFFVLVSRPWLRVVTIAVYIPLATMVVTGHALLFLCIVFGDCL
jgi:hypothetical protein